METNDENANQSPSTIARSGLWLLVFALCAIAGISTFYFVREHRQARQLEATNQKLSASLSQAQSQLSALTEKLNTLAAPSPAPAATAPAPVRPSAMPVKVHKKLVHRVAVHQQPPDDPRWGQMQSQLSEQQKQLASTREEMEKNRADLDGRLNSTRADLDGRLNSTRDELNGSIARTHDELVVLQKRGERNFYEFQLDKSKAFQRVGPVSLSLRKVNLKHKNYNLALMVDDSQLDKKNVNLYEPIWITLSDRPQPIELVVNKVTKDRIEGYLSEPKYKKSELAANAAPAADKTQAAVTPH